MNNNQSKDESMGSLGFHLQNSHSSKSFFLNEPIHTVFTVSEVTTKIKKFLNQEFSAIWLRGEVSEVKLSSNGHLFFNIKDENASLSCVMFYNRLRKLKFDIEPGVVFNCLGNITVYEKRGSYQLVVEDITPEGQGSFELAFKQLKERLEKEGLFDSVHKKPIPKYPHRVGIITSDKGAAIKDILKTIDTEYPFVEILILPVPVQGEEAASKITEMIERVNQHDWVDLIILTRGGGSREDLWVFNEETIARAIFASRLPIISAIGHEVDIVISDLVADHRASTPTEAANFISQHKKNLTYELPLFSRRLHRAMKNHLIRLKLKTQTFAEDHWIKFFQSRLDYFRYELKSMNKSNVLLFSQKIRNQKNEIKIFSEKMHSLSPKKVLERGFSLITKDDRIITDLTKLKSEDQIQIYTKKDKKTAKIL